MKQKQLQEVDKVMTQTHFKLILQHILYASSVISVHRAMPPAPRHRWLSGHTAQAIAKYSPLSHITLFLVTVFLIYIYYEIVHKVHNKKKMKKDKEKIKTQNKNIFKTTLNYYIRLSEYS